MRAQQRPGDGNVVRRDLDELPENALRRGPFSDRYDWRVVSIAPGRIRSALDCNHRAMQWAFYWIAFSLDVHEAAAWEIPAIYDPAGGPRLTRVTVH